MSNIKKLTEYEEAMETICDECQTRYPVKDNYCQCNCMVRQIWRNILDEKKARADSNGNAVVNFDDSEEI